MHYQSGIAPGDIRIAELIRLQTRIALLDVPLGKGVDQDGVGRDLALKCQIAAEGSLEGELVNHQKIIVYLQADRSLDLLAVTIIIALRETNDAVKGCLGSHVVVNGNGSHSQL